MPARARPLRSTQHDNDGVGLGIPLHQEPTATIPVVCRDGTAAFPYGCSHRTLRASEQACFDGTLEELLDLLGPEMMLRIDSVRGIEAYLPNQCVISTALSDEARTEYAQRDSARETATARLSLIY